MSPERKRAAAGVSRSGSVSSSRLRRCGIAVDFKHLTRASLPRELLHVRPSTHGETLSERTVPQQRHDAFSYRLDAVGGHVQHVIAQHLVQHRNVRGDHGGTARQGFERWQSEALDERDVNEGTAEMIQSAQRAVIDVSGYYYATSEL